VPRIEPVEDESGSCTIGSLWPPNHKYVTSRSHVEVDLSGCLQGDINAATSVEVTHVTSDELDDDAGDGSTCNDIILLSGSRVALRAERAGGGDGRVYTAHVVVHTPVNDIALAIKFEVRHSPNTPAVDSGPQYCVGSGCGTIPGSNCLP
jgi:hypothetical protein